MKRFATMALCLLNVLVAGDVSPKKALIFGITGQDGSYLAELLLEKGYEVHGVYRRTSTFSTTRINHLYESPEVKDKKLFMHYGDLTDTARTIALVHDIEPDEIYNLAAESHELVSFRMPEYTCNVNALGTLRILDAIRTGKKAKETRFFQASSNHIFGSVAEIPQTEHTSMHPTSPYGTSKLFAYWITKNYREAFGIHACNGILFNHTSPNRNGFFVTRKITHAIGAIARGDQTVLQLGNIDAMRDWGFAKDYIEAIWLALQHEEPDDYVVATGESHTVREFVELAFKEVGIDIEWEGSGIEERGINKANGKTVVAIDCACFRHREISCSLGDASKSCQKLNWKPSTTFNDLIKIMVQADLSGQNPR